MTDYDPGADPDPVEWLALDEGERIALVENYHEEAGIELPNSLLHATIHTTVETQVAMGDEIPVRRTLDRLKSEGLERHEAIHAIGSVLAEHIYVIVKEKRTRGEDPNLSYFAALERLTARRWKNSAR
jgi:hypothetical protein